MHGAGIPSISPLANVAAQAVNALASRASTTATNSGSELQSGNVAGAQSFLTALQQKLGAQGATAGDAISAQMTQLSNDLKTGDLSAAQNDLSSLRVGVFHLKGMGWPASGNGSATGGPASDPSGAIAPASLAALASYNGLEQSAFNGALNLSLPEAVPSLSVNS